MICPTCGTHIPDNATRCPACHAQVAAAASPAAHGIWCPSCGAGASWTDEVCPNCGYPIALVREERLSRVPDVYDTQGDDAPAGRTADETSDTRSIARIESAIPSEDDPETKVNSSERMPRVSRFMLASVASILLVCSIVLVLTHPWDPDAYSTRATKEADTSMAGFPGTVEELSGQDSSAELPDPSLTGDDALYAQLSDAYQKLGRYAERANECEASYEQRGVGADADARPEGRRTADALAIDIDKLVDALKDMDVTASAYAEDHEHMLMLAAWLRTRVEFICTAWRQWEETGSADTDDLAGTTHIEGTDTYKELFDESYDAWKPEAVTQE